jgi:multicomponent Na+:H+ antiporter subunit F
MNTDIAALNQICHMVLLGALVVLIIFVVLCLLRAVLGPTVADRIVAINMCGTMVMVMIGVLAIMLSEGYLVDICMIYAMISFLAVIVITKIYMGVHVQHQVETGDNDAARSSKSVSKEER